MRTLIRIIFLCILLMPAGAFSEEKGVAIKGVRYFSYPTFTRIVFEVEAAAPYVLTRAEGEHRLVFTAFDGPLAVKGTLPAISNGVVKNIEQKDEGGKLFVFINLDSTAGEAKDFVLRNPDRIVIDITKGAAPAAAQPLPKQTVIVLDPGHGGRDTGIVAAQGQEKGLTLDLALILKRLFQKNSNIKVILTREKDQSLTLDDRAAISNSAGAMIFLSLHYAPGKDARIYIPEPETGQAQQTATSRRDFLGFEAVSEHEEILWGRQQAEHIKESSGLGRRLMQQFTGRERADPIQAPLALLKAVDAAAVMVEVGIEQDRKKTAETIVKGLEHYAGQNR